MHRASTTILAEIDMQDLSGTAGRHFAEVVHVNVKPNGFVQGTARVGRTQIRFDSYSFQEAVAGFELGPFALPGYDPGKGRPLQKNSSGLQGRKRNTMLYGTVVQPAPGRYRFLDAVVANEFFFFWSTIKYGASFVHANKFKYYRYDDNGSKTDGSLYAAACLLIGDAHTLMHECLPPDKRPPSHTDLNLAMDPASFVLLLSMMARSSEPWRLFATVLRSRKTTVLPEHLLRLNFVDPCTAEMAGNVVSDGCTVDLSNADAARCRLCPITPAVVRFAVSKQQEKIRAQLLGERTDAEADDDKDANVLDEEEESCGILSDGEEELEEAAEKMCGAFQDPESEGSDLSDGDI